MSAERRELEPLPWVVDEIMATRISHALALHKMRLRHPRQQPPREETNQPRDSNDA